MSRTRLLGVTAFLALSITGGMTGCATNTPAAPPTQPPPTHPAPKPSGPPGVIGTPLPVAINAATPPMLTAAQINQEEPGGTPDVGSDTDQVVATIRKQTLELAGVSGTITASCPTMDWHDGARDTCRSTFDGVPIDWAVDITSAVFVTYQLTPERGVLTAGYAYAQFWSGFHHRSDQLTCDPIPAAVPVTIDDAGYAPTGYRCAYLGPVRDNTRTWTYVPIDVGPRGNIEPYD